MEYSTTNSPYIGLIKVNSILNMNTPTPNTKSDELLSHKGLQDILKIHEPSSHSKSTPITKNDKSQKEVLDIHEVLSLMVNVTSMLQQHFELFSDNSSSPLSLKAHLHTLKTTIIPFL